MYVLGARRHVRSGLHPSQCGMRVVTGLEASDRLDGVRPKATPFGSRLHSPVTGLQLPFALFVPPASSCPCSSLPSSLSSRCLVFVLVLVPALVHVLVFVLVLVLVLVLALVRAFVLVLVLVLVLVRVLVLVLVLAFVLCPKGK